MNTAEPSLEIALPLRGDPICSMGCRITFLITWTATAALSLGFWTCRFRKFWTTMIVGGETHSLARASRPTRRLVPATVHVDFVDGSVVLAWLLPRRPDCRFV
jgi:hypothetical protein